MQKVTGIGGFFFRAEDPKALAEWYHEHLGIDPVPGDFSVVHGHDGAKAGQILVGHCAAG